MKTINLQLGTLPLNLKLKNRLEDLLQQFTIDADHFFGYPGNNCRYPLNTNLPVSNVTAFFPNQ